MDIFSVPSSLLTHSAIIINSQQDVPQTLLNPPPPKNSNFQHCGKAIYLLSIVNFENENIYSIGYNLLNQLCFTIFG